MKKGLIITASVLGTLLLIAGLTWLILPGLPDYLRVKLTMPQVDSDLPDFVRAEVPADYVTYEIRGVRLSVPAEYELLDTGHGFRSADGKVGTLISQFDQATMYDYLPDYDPWENYLYTEAEYRHYFASVGAPYPDDGEARTTVLWYCRDVLRAKDVLHLRGKDRAVFRELAEVRRDSLQQEDTWRITVPGGDGFVCRSNAAENPAGAYWSLTLFPEGGGSVYDLVYTREPDGETARRIFSSVEIAVSPTDL